MTKVYKWFGGTTRLYAMVFTAAGIALAFADKLTPTFVAFVAAIQALILAHSAKEDYNARTNSVPPPEQANPPGSN